MKQFRPIRVALLGAGDGALRTHLEAALTQGHVRCQVVPPDPGGAELVLAVVRRGEAPGVIAAARTVAQRAPVIAILPAEDENLALETLQRGAQAFWPLDAPRDLLRSMVVVLAGSGEPVGGRAN